MKAPLIYAWAFVILLLVATAGAVTGASAAALSNSYAPQTKVKPADLYPGQAGPFEFVTPADDAAPSPSCCNSDHGCSSQGGAACCSSLVALLSDQPVQARHEASRSLLSPELYVRHDGLGPDVARRPPRPTL